MTQRNPMNERYTVERQGKTRKSSASAKPKSERAATLRDPAPKTKKQKKQERQEREAKQQKRIYTMKARYEDTQEYKHLRHIWWGALIAAICCTVVSFLISSNPGFFGSFMPENAVTVTSIVVMVAAYGCIIYAFFIDFSRVRKGRQAFEARALLDNSKESRALQKQARAEAREREREEAKKAEEAAQTPPQEPKKSFLDRFKRPKSATTAETIPTKEAESTDKK